MHDDIYYGADDWLDDLYRNFAKEVLAGGLDLYEEVIAKFTSERLQSYYVRNPNIAERALWALKQARSLRAVNPEACLLFAVTAAEVGLNSCLLKPILHGLVHHDAMAIVIGELVPEQRNDKFRNLLFGILREYGGIDLRTYKRKSVKQTLWEELLQSQRLRNSVIHRGDEINAPDAQQAVDVASLIVENLLPAVITKLGLHTNDKLEVSIKKH